jgi:AraC-like DNA-binding protein
MRIRASSLASACVVEGLTLIGKERSIYMLWLLGMGCVISCLPDNHRQSFTSVDNFIRPKDAVKRTIMTKPVQISPFPLLKNGIAVAALAAEGSTLHSHPTAQLYCLTKGMVVIEESSGLLAVPPRQTGWLPPDTPHSARAHGEIAGWAAYIAPELCAGLAPQACILQCSVFVPLIMERILTWQQAGLIKSERPLQASHERMMQVFLDELRLARPTNQRLPFPRDERLVRIIRGLMENPGDARSIAEWGAHVGMSERGVNRHFHEETGLTFAQWRRLHRLWKSRELLTQGSTVQEAAWTSGYENVSAFIKVFQEIFGLTPAKYRSETGSSVDPQEA